MSIKKLLLERSNGICELCSSNNGLEVYEISPNYDDTINTAVLLCEKCMTEINKTENFDTNHWRCLSDSMWSEHPPVQVMAWRQLTSLSEEGWAQSLRDQMYMDEETFKWANALENQNEKKMEVKDSNGTILDGGDAVTLIKDLVVKGAGFTAKRGTLVKNIRLTENPDHIEGRVNGTMIVLFTNFLKKV